MTQGFLLFSYDNEQLKYGLMSLWVARRIRLWLDKPTSLVTDQSTVNSLDSIVPNWRRDFDKVILVDSLTKQKRKMEAHTLTFHNVNRIMSWDLTPYDETIVIDTDIVIQSQQFNKLWNNSEDLVVCDKSSSLFGESIKEFEIVHENSIKFFWATVFYFRKTEQTKIFFDYCRWVRDNYAWNSRLFYIANSLIRNDYIWSIALHQLGGQAGSSWASTIPWSLPFTTTKDRVVRMTDTDIVLMHDTEVVRVKNQDVHVMNKFDLMQQIKKELAV